MMSKNEESPVHKAAKIRNNWAIVGDFLETTDKLGITICPDSCKEDPKKGSLRTEDLVQYWSMYQ